MSRQHERVEREARTRHCVEPDADIRMQHPVVIEQVLDHRTHTQQPAVLSEAPQGLADLGRIERHPADDAGDPGHLRSQIEQPLALGDGRRGLYEDSALDAGLLSERSEMPGPEVAIENGVVGCEPAVVVAGRRPEVLMGVDQGRDSAGLAAILGQDPNGRVDGDVKLGQIRTMAPRITGLSAHDVRFPTSDGLHGSDAMNPDPDYSAAVAILETSDPVLQGHGMTFTIGRGNEICVAAIRAFERHVVGRDLDDIEADLGGFWRALAGDSQLRWLGPEKGVIHLALAAVVNAAWDLVARRANQPLWKYLCDLPPDAIVRAVDFRHITDALPPDEARERLEERLAGRRVREGELHARGYPAYVTSAGWLGYDDDMIRARCRAALADGWTHFKIKVGADRDDDVRRCRIVREEIGPDRKLMVDANQVWDVDQAIAHIEALAGFDLWWVEEPTSPDDVLGHARIATAVAPTRIATGEHCHNRVMVKQLLQARATQVLQIDGCRLGGVTEVIASLLLADKFGVPVCPHAGGVGLCQHVQHFSAFDYVAVSGSLDERITEYAEHLHEHFVTPIRMESGRYRLPDAPGLGVEFRAESLAAYTFPDGSVWRRRAGPGGDHPARTVE